MPHAFIEFHTSKEKGSDLLSEFRSDLQQLLEGLMGKSSLMNALIGESWLLYPINLKLPVIVFGSINKAELSDCFCGYTGNT